MPSLQSAKNAESVILLKKTEPEALSASDEANFYQESLTSFTGISIDLTVIAWDTQALSV